MSLVEQELLTLPEHLSSPPVFSGVRVTRSLVLYVCIVDRCCSFAHSVVCSSSIYGFWLPLWYLQTLLIEVGIQFFFKSNCSKSQLLSWFESLPGYLPKIAFKYFENQLFTVIIVLLIPEMYVKKITGLRAFLNIKQS